MLEQVKEQCRQLFSKVRSLTENGLNKVHSPQTLRTVLFIIAGVIGTGIAVVAVVKFMEMIFSIAYNFFERHFFGITCLIGIGCYIKTYKDKKNEEEARRQREEKMEGDRKKLKFATGTYDKLRRFLYTSVLIEPNIEDLTGLYRPLNATELGDVKHGYYITNGLVHYQFRVPKRTLDDLDIATVTSILQSLLDLKIGTIGISGLLSPTHQSSNDILMISEIADMKTYAQITLIFDFNGEFAEQMAYDRAIVESMNRSTIERTLVDKDYG